MARNLRVLVAEDNPVNLRIVTTLLLKQGHEVVGVSDGRPALEAFRKERFDLMLLDVHMPQMDGLEVAREVRAVDRQVIIVALTGDNIRDECIEAGMNDCLEKPLSPQALRELLQRSVGFDREAALQRVEGQEDLLRDVAEVFLEDYPHAVEAIQQGLDKEDAAAVSFHAHKLKGALAALSAHRAQYSAKLLDEAARGGDLRTAARLVEQLQVELQLLAEELRAMSSER